MCSPVCAWNRNELILIVEKPFTPFLAATLSTQNLHRCTNNYCFSTVPWLFYCFPDPPIFSSIFGSIFMFSFWGIVAVSWNSYRVEVAVGIPVKFRCYCWLRKHTRKLSSIFFCVNLSPPISLYYNNFFCLKKRSWNYWACLSVSDPGSSL